MSPGRLARKTPLDFLYFMFMVMVFVDVVNLLSGGRDDFIEAR